jgi:hypothetical protein
LPDANIPVDIVLKNEGGGEVLFDDSVLALVRSASIVALKKLLLLEGVHMCSPTPSNAWKKLEVLFRWRIGLMVNTVSCYAIHKLELDV